MDAYDFLIWCLGFLWNIPEVNCWVFVSYFKSTLSRISFATTAFSFFHFYFYEISFSIFLLLV